MKLLIATQAVDERDPALGFFVRWIEEFSKHAETVEVIALKVGKYTLPANVRVHSLGKEKGPPRVARRAAYAARFLALAWRLRREYDAVFVHMNPEYVVLGGVLWKAFRMSIVLWYVHRSADLKLRLAEKLADVVLTASPESFRMKSEKARYMRQAVDVDRFARPSGKIRGNGNEFRLVSVGRITPIKNLDSIVDALAAARTAGLDASLKLIGAPVTEDDRMYAMRLHARARALGLERAVSFVGSVRYNDIAPHYWAADASINACPTGGMDKAVLESLASSTPVFVSNKAFASVLGGYEDVFMFPERDADALAKRFIAYAARADRRAIADALARRVRRDYGLPALIENIVTALARL